MRFKSFQAVLVAMLAAFGIASLGGCGGGGGSAAVQAAAAAKTAVVVGKVELPKAAKLAGLTLAAGDPIDVHVQSDPEIKTTVGADGTFTLRGLPEGSFVLVFTQGGTPLGTLAFSAVAANQQITITVQVVENEVVLLDEDRRGIGHAGIELEGLVQNVIGLHAAPLGDSTFVIAGRTVIARPGVTAIREGVTARTVEDVTAGKQVHVKGTAIENSTSVLAYEIKLQNPTTTSPTDGEEQKVTICHKPPGNPGKGKTLSIGASAWPAHQAHGDTQGACPP